MSFPSSGASRISFVTRRALFQELSNSASWHGELRQVEFLSRLYKLEELPSTDRRCKNAAEDIVCHTEENPEDWAENWVFIDDRFGLLRCSDNEFLSFLRETVHPVVRPNAAEGRRLALRFNEHLRVDGWELYEAESVSGRPVFAARRATAVAAGPPLLATVEKGFPVEIEDLLASMYALLRERGAAREIAIISASQAHGYQSHYDNWDGGTYYYTVRLATDLGLFSRLSEDERKQAAQLLTDVAKPFFAEFSHQHLSEVTIHPRPVTSERWRADATEFLSGTGITNQGRVRSDNIASRECDGLLFRSESEIHLYRALKALGVTFAPLPVFLRGGDDYRRFEPDFVLFKDGVLMVVEVDGDTYHRELPAVAHARLAPLDHEGAKVERVRAEDCGTAETAKACAERLMKLLEKRIAQGT
jgi:hypothetical protein